MAGVHAKDVERALNSADFPAGKDELVDHVQAHDAPEDVVKAIRGLPLGEYRNVGDVLASVTLD